MMNKLLLTALSLLTVTVASPSAHAFSIVAGVNQNFNSVSGKIMGVDTKEKGGTGFDVGLLWNFSKIEIGAIYVSTKTTATVSGTDVSGSTNALSIPVVYQLGNRNFTFNIGGFYDVAISSDADSDYGVVAGPRFYFGKLFVDARFAYGLKSNDVPFDTPQSVHSQTATLLLGLRFN